MIAVVVAACSSKPSTAPDAAGDAGADAPVDLSTVDELVAACEVDAACDIVRGSDKGVNDCLKYFAEGRGLLTPQQIRCMATAGANCDQARACVGETLVAPSSCTANSCDGTRASLCGFGLQLIEDCTQLIGEPPGVTCLDNAGTVKCSLGTCAAGDADSCDGTIGKRCNAPFVDATDCAALGLVCQVISGTAECTGDGAACTVDRRDAVAIYDCRTGFEHRVECATAIPGTSPQMDPTSSRSFCGFATDCLPWMASVQCSGATTLSVCAFGAVRDLDCTSLGFAGCSVARCQ